MCSKPDINTFYNIQSLKDRIKEVRKYRYKQYTESRHTDQESKYDAFQVCKSQATLAEKLNVSRQTILDWENGHGIPSIDNLINLCHVFNCSIDYLLGAGGDIPDIDPITKASHYSGIKSTIIRYGLENQDYLDCLNFFMLPENCASLFNGITLSAWKKYWVDSILTELKNPLKDDIIHWYDEYNAITPFSELNVSTYKSFLKKKLPKEKIIVSSSKGQTGTKIKSCIKPIIYQNFFENKEFNYESFIEYLANYTFQPLSHNAMIELQKAKLSNAFVNLVTEYLEEL